MNIEYSNPGATVEQVKTAIHASKVIMQRPPSLMHAFPRIALVGYDWYGCICTACGKTRHDFA